MATGVRATSRRVAREDEEANRHAATVRTRLADPAGAKEDVAGGEVAVDELVRGQVRHALGNLAVEPGLVLKRRAVRHLFL